MNKSLRAALVKIRTCGGRQLFHSTYNGVVARKIFHRPEQMEVRRRQIRTIRWMWYDSPAKIDNVLHGLQTGMGPGVILLQEKGCLLLWPDSGNSSLQLSQRRDIAIRFDRLSGFKEVQKDSPFPKPKDNAHHFTRWGQHLELFLWWGIRMSPLHGLPFWLRLVVVTPRLVTGDDAIQETVTFRYGADFYERSTQALVHRRRKCIANGADYVEKYCFVAKNVLCQIVLLCSLYLL